MVISDTSNPDIILVVRTGLLSTQSSIESVIRDAGYNLVCTPTLPEEIGLRPILVVCHLRSTLIAPHDISGYIDFLMDYYGRQKSCDMRLIVITPRAEDGPDSMIGYAALVDTYLTEPVEPQVLLGLIQRLFDQI